MPPLTNLERLAAQEAYADTHHLLDAVILRQVLEYGGDSEELRSQADEWWMKAFQTYDETCGTSFKTWVKSKATFGMLEEHRRQYGRNNQLPRKFPDLTRVAAKEEAPEFDLDEFLDGLSDDAKVVVQLVLESPIDVEMNLHLRGGDEPKNYKGAVRELLHDLGWPFRRVVQAYQEIKEYL